MRFSYQIGMCETSHYLPLAKAAEAAGFHGITIPDSICYPQEASSKYPYNQDGSREFLESVPFANRGALLDEQIVAALQKANTDSAVGAMAITGQPGAFSAGGDMNELFLPKMHGEAP